MLGSFSPVGGTQPHVRGRTCRSHYLGKAIRQSRVALAWPAPLVRSERRLCLQLPEKGLGFRQPAINYDPGLAAWTCQFPSVFCFVTVSKGGSSWLILGSSSCVVSLLGVINNSIKISQRTRQAVLDRGWKGLAQKDPQWGHVRSHRPNLETFFFFTSQVRLTCVSHLTQCWLSSWQENTFDVLTPWGGGGHWWNGIPGQLETKNLILLHSTFGLCSG